jgi:hypothetical protein
MWLTLRIGAGAGGIRVSNSLISIATLPFGSQVRIPSSALPPPKCFALRHGVRDGQAMIATLRHKLIRVPARLVHHAGALTLRLPPGYPPLKAVLARIRALPTTP